MVSPKEMDLMTEKDAYDLWWDWAEEPVDSKLTISGGDPRGRDGASAGGPARPRQGLGGLAI